MAMSFDDLHFHAASLPKIVTEDQILKLPPKEFIVAFGAEGVYDFYGHISPGSLARPGECFLSGGALRRIVEGNPGGDFDYYFASERALDRADMELDRQDFFKDRWSTAVQEYRSRKSPEVVQLIHFTAFPDVRTVIDTNDFTNCQFAYDGEFVYFTAAAIQDTRQRVLRPARCMEVGRSIARVAKFVAMGYTISDEDARTIEAQCTDWRISNNDGFADIGETR